MGSISMIACTECESYNEPQKHPIVLLRILTSNAFYLQEEEKGFDGVWKAFHVLAQDQALTYPFPITLDETLALRI
jgi:hypothetical protein